MHFQALAGRMIETAHEFIALTWKVILFFLIGAPGCSCATVFYFAYWFVFAIGAGVLFQSLMG